MNKKIKKIIITSAILLNSGFIMACGATDKTVNNELNEQQLLEKITVIEQALVECENQKNYAHQLAENARLLGEEDDSYIIYFAKNEWNIADNAYNELSQELEVLTAEYDKIIAEKNSKGTYLGNFKITHYCAGSCCNGSYSGTALGTPIVAGTTIAVDKNVIPLGSEVYIEGYGTRIAQDTGGAIKGNRIDIAVGSHSEAMSKGVVYADVYIK